MPAATAVTRWFSRYRGRTMAVTLSASGFAGFFVAPLINRILTANGGNWRQAWAIVAGGFLLLAIVASPFFWGRPGELGPLVGGGAGGGPSVTRVGARGRGATIFLEAQQ